MTADPVIGMTQLRVLAAKQPHDIGKGEVAEIGRARQPVLTIS
jgi:hypothetical protein